MGDYTTELRFGVAFDEPTEQGWTFGNRDTRDAAERTLLVSSGVDPIEVSKLEDDDLHAALSEHLNLEIPFYNNGSPLGQYILSLAGSVKYVHQGNGRFLSGKELQIRMEDLLRLEWAVKELGLKATQPSWMLMSVYV